MNNFEKFGEKAGGMEPLGDFLQSWLGHGGLNGILFLSDFILENRQLFFWYRNSAMFDLQFTACAIFCTFSHMLILICCLYI